MFQTRYGKLVGWGGYVPEKVVTNHDLAKILNTSHEWIVQRTGIEERRIAGPDEQPSTMGTAAAVKALDVAGLKPADIDCIVVGNTAPDFLTPSVANIIQHRLGAPHIPAFVVEAGCTGFVHALTVAQQFIHTGAYRRILVIGVEMLSRHIDWEDRATAVLFGDGAGAVILEAVEEPCGVLGFDLGSDGSMAEELFLPGGGTVEPFSADVLANRRHYVHMNGRAVFKFASRVIGPSCRATLAQAEMSLDEIDWIIPHQANLRIIQAAARDMNVPLERFYVNIQRFANTSVASIPLALAEGLTTGVIKPEHKILVVSFGAGLTWASAAWQLTPDPVARRDRRSHQVLVAAD